MKRWSIYFKRSLRMFTCLAAAALMLSGCRQSGADVNETSLKRDVEKEESTVETTTEYNNKGIPDGNGETTVETAIGNDKEAITDEVVGTTTEAASEAVSQVQEDCVVTRFPTIYSDVPDIDIIRVDDTYYMVSTTMNLCPGVPIMKSTDLVHWRIVNYVYDTFEDDDITNLRNGQDMYSRGSWAASLKYNEADKLYYVGFTSNNHGFYIYTTDDIENGEWKKYHTSKGFHDPALFFEDDRLYVISASGGSCRITGLELTENGEILTTADFGTQTLFTADGWGLWEGAHAYKVGDYYYIFIIASPTNRWIRTQLCYRSRELIGGEWEEKIVYQKGIGGSSAGLAQGGIVDTINGDWYAFLFQDRGGIGRSPSIIAVNWEQDWPLMGAYDIEGHLTANEYINKMTINLKEDEAGSYIVDSDDFNYAEGEGLKLVWQWNHNPQNDFWSVTDRPGYLRLTTDVIADNVYYAHNSLTQRTLAPKFWSEVKLSTDNMKPGDYAGICAVADKYAMVGIMCDDAGNRYIYQADADFKTAFEQPNEIIDTALEPGQEICLRIDYEFKNGTSDNAVFSYSYDGENFTTIGRKQSLGFSTATTFMGTRTWLFNYATGETGGYVDFDYYKAGDPSGEINTCGMEKNMEENKKTFGKNPIISSIYTADPAPMVYGDTLYLYTTHDEDELINDFYTMFNWHCYSTKDMVNWTDHGQIFSLDDISWADDRAWAPQCIERNGKFYLYCPVHKKNGGMAIAVGVADSPVGPFKDLGHPLVDEGDWNDIDPTVFIDDGGQAYLYFGNPELRYVLLNEDMISYDEKVGVVKIPMTEEAFAKGSHTTGTTYAEGPWFYKRNGIYYMVYAAFGEGKKDEHLAYSTSTTPTGPWVYGGVLMTEEGGTFTNHPGIADFKGHSYLFYHTGELPGGSLFHRSVCVAEFHYNDDGSIDTIAKCDGVNAVE